MVERPALSGTIAWLLIFSAVFIWSVFNPKDRLTWWLEVVPALIALGLLAITFTKFPLTALSYWLILIHSVILMVGAHYTYAEVPLFDWIKDVVNGTRNNYDKVGHFAQGFVPAIVAREILLRNNVMTGGGWLFFVVTCICLAVSASYELIEWWVALLSKQAAEAFLGTQGYVWDTQSDMTLALLGAISAQIFLRKLHDHQLGIGVSDTF